MKKITIVAYAICFLSGLWFLFSAIKEHFGILSFILGIALIYFGVINIKRILNDSNENKEREREELILKKIGVLVKIFSLFVTMFFVKDKMNKLRSMNETLSYLLLSSLAGAAFTASQSFFSLELFFNNKPYNPDNMISVALFSLGNYFVENSYFYYLLGASLIAFLFFRFYLLRNKIVLELETKELQKLHSRKRKNSILVY